MDRFLVSVMSKMRNQKVLVMFSGGKDSALCLALLKKFGANVEAIHFRHKWGWKLSTTEAKRISKQLKIKMKIVDYTPEFLKRVIGFTDGRPCKICKIGMYKKTLAYAKENNINFVCVGDNASDTIVNRLMQYVGKRDRSNLSLTKYLDCLNEGIKVPNTIRIFRPLIYMPSKKVEAELKKLNIIIKRNHETGDKYFEYWREGCPIQYNEPGTNLTLKRMKDLLEYNLLATKIAKKNGFRASVHLPSGKIVTVPEGREEKVREYLLRNGKHVPKMNKGIINKPHMKHIIIEVNGVDSNFIINSKATLPLIRRFIEMTKLKVIGEKAHDFVPYGSTMLFVLSSSHLAVHTWPEKNYIHFDLLSCGGKITNQSLKNTLFEIFKTNNYKIRRIRY